MVLPAGMPRLDEYLDPKYRAKTTEELLHKFPILSKRVILFAPTYRGENKKHAYYPYEMIDFDRLYEVLQKTNSVFIFKMHPFISEPVPIPKKYSDRMYDISSYPNINDLFYVTDLLITDYSSNIYEFSLMRKPMLFFAYDIDAYSNSRGFHRDYRSNVPGKITETFDEMCDAILNEDFEYEKVHEYVENNFEKTDSHACDRIIDWIIKGNPYARAQSQCCQGLRCLAHLQICHSNFYHVLSPYITFQAMKELYHMIPVLGLRENNLLQSYLRQTLTESSRAYHRIFQILMQEHSKLLPAYQLSN